MIVACERQDVPDIIRNAMQHRSGTAGTAGFLRQSLDRKIIVLQRHSQLHPDEHIMQIPSDYVASSRICTKCGQGQVQWEGIRTSLCSQCRITRLKCSAKDLMPNRFSSLSSNCKGSSICVANLPTSPCTKVFFVHSTHHCQVFWCAAGQQSRQMSMQLLLCIEQHLHWLQAV